VSVARAVLVGHENGRLAVAQPLDALTFREIFGRAVRSQNSGFDQAFTVAPIDPNTQPREASRIVEATRRSLVDIMDHGEINYVSAEITQLLLETAWKLDHKRVFHFEEGDFPTRLGMLYFDGPIQIPTIISASGEQRLRGLLWGQLVQHPDDKAGATYLVPGSYNDRPEIEVIGKVVYTIVDSIRDYRDRRFERSQDYRKRNAGMWATRHFLPIVYHERFDFGTLSKRVDNTAWGDGALTEDEQVQDALDAEASVNLVLRMLLAWTAFQQTEIYGHHMLDARDHDRILVREGRPPAKVRIIALRRYAPSSEFHNLVETHWTHRWKVREHYRNQRVGPGRSFIRRTLIREHVKGPKDKPIAEQDTIQAFVR